MKKTIYEAPQMELIEIRFEGNILLSVNAAMSTLSNSTTEEADEYNSGNAITW